MKKQWTFKVAIVSRRDEVLTWINTQQVKVRAKIKERIDDLEIAPIGDWVRPYIDKIHGYDKLREIRIKFNSNEYRLIGCFGPERREFTFLIGAVERDGKFTPRSALDIADRRSKDINKEGYTNDYRRAQADYYRRAKR